MILRASTTVLSGPKVFIDCASTVLQLLPPEPPQLVSDVVLESNNCGDVPSYSRYPVYIGRYCKLRSMGIDQTLLTRGRYHTPSEVAVSEMTIWRGGSIDYSKWSVRCQKGNCVSTVITYLYSIGNILNPAANCLLHLCLHTILSPKVTGAKNFTEAEL